MHLPAYVNMSLYLDCLSFSTDIGTVFSKPMLIFHEYCYIYAGRILWYFLHLEFTGNALKSFPEFCNWRHTMVFINSCNRWTKWRPFSSCIASFLGPTIREFWEIWNIDSRCSSIHPVNQIAFFCFWIIFISSWNIKRESGSTNFIREEYRRDW